MRHQRSRLRLKQKPAHAKMMQRNLVTSVLLYESVRTTKKRAQVVQPLIDRLINYAKNHPPQLAIRYINRIVTDKNASRKIMEVYLQRYQKRSSGLSSIKPLGVRQGDGAQLVQLTLMDATLGAAVAPQPTPAAPKTPKKPTSPKKPTANQPANLKPETKSATASKTTKKTATKKPTTKKASSKSTS